MQRKKSIGILLFLLFFIFVFVFIYRISYYNALTDLEEDKAEEYQSLDDFYWIKEEDGMVVVYYADEDTVFDYTTIPMKSLPLTVQMEIDEGKKVDSLSQVYGFLENYSS